ncbi:MAG TPA: hypothetical protein VIY90_22805, partial [Steroidobacteraceae bacterium]
GRIFKLHVVSVPERSQDGNVKIFRFAVVANMQSRMGYHRLILSPNSNSSPPKKPRLRDDAAN